MKPRTPCLAILMALLYTAIAAGCTMGNLAVPDTPEAEFTPLFDGESFAGWKAVGDSQAFTIDDGEIVGRSAGIKQNSFLRTDKHYSDFEFRCQFKWDRPSNSGIQYRSHQYPSTDPMYPKRVYGYQFELDPSPRAWSGGLYEEGRDGWLVNLEGEDKALKRAAIKLEGWNDIVIECRGDRIRTWLNGVSIINQKDPREFAALRSGFFALQVHKGGNGQFRWRRLRVKEFPKQD